MTASLWPQVVTAIVGVLTAGLDDDVTVFDGPAPADDASLLAVSVGMSTRDDYAGRAEQIHATAGPVPLNPREETASVNCSAWAWSGDDWDFSGLRAQVDALLTDVHDLVGPITTLGLPQITTLQLLDDVFWVQQQDTTGTTCEAMFTIAYTATFT